MIKAVDAQNAACNAVVQLVDQGSLNPSGSLTLLDASSTLIASFVLSNPAFLPAVDGTSVSSYITDSTSIVDGTASVFNILDRDTSVVWSGTVSNFAGIGDLKLNSISIPQDSTISLTQIVYSVPEYFVNIGNQGVTGVQGSTGLQGPTGIQGSIGDQGLTGVQGFAGSGPQDVSINTVPIAIDSSDWANSVIYQDSTAGLILTINPINELNLSSANISINGLQQCTMSTVDNSGFFQIISDGTAIISAPIIMFPNLPVIPGPSGSLWNNDGTLMIAS